MRSAIHTTFGEPSEVLELIDRPIPQPGAGEVRIKTLLAPIHNHDLWTIRGSYGYKPELPAIGGSEAVGIVDALGEGVSGPAVACARSLGACVSGIGPTRQRGAGFAARKPCVRSSLWQCRSSKCRRACLARHALASMDSPLWARRPHAAPPRSVCGAHFAWGEHDRAGATGSLHPARSFHC